MQIKTGDVRESTPSDFDNTKKAEFYDKKGHAIADAAHKNKLSDPAPLNCVPCKQKIEKK